MVSIPSGVNVPGADKAVIDIAAKIKAMPAPCGWGSTPLFAVCIAEPKNKQLPLYVPAFGTTVEGRLSSMGITLKIVTGYADSNGVVSFCISDSIFAVLGLTYQFRVKQYNIDFGNGNSQWSNWQLDKPFMLFEGKIDIPCTSGTFPINADFPGLIPKVWSDPISISVPGYKTITPYGMPFTIYINNVEIGSGTFTGAPLSFTSTKKLTDIPALLAAMGKSVEVKAVIKFGTCEWVGKKTVTLPALPCSGLISIAEPDWTSLLSGPTLPGSIAVPFTITAASGAEIPDKIPIDIFIDYTKAFYYEGKPGNNSIDILAIIRTVLGAAALNTAHTMTMVVNAPDCNIPAPPPLNIPPLIPAAPAFGIISIPSVPKPPKIPYPVKISIDGILAGEPPISKEVPAGIHNITAELKGMTNIYRKVSVESGKTLTITDIAFEEILVPCTVWDTTANVYIPSILQLPFNIDISNANWICKATGEKTPVNATAELLVGAQKFYIPIYSGAGSFSLTQADIDNIIAGIITTPTTPPTTPTTPTGCDITGRIGEPGNYLVPLSEVQDYLDKCHPGGTAETTTGTWAGAFKITRGAGGKYPAGTYFWAIKWEDIRRYY